MHVTDLAEKVTSGQGGLQVTRGGLGDYDSPVRVDDVREHICQKMDASSAWTYSRMELNCSMEYSAAHSAPSS